MSKTMTTTKNDKAVQRAPRYQVPRTDIVEVAGAYLLQAEMPGVAKSGLEITLEQGNLEIIGHRTPHAATGKAEYVESCAFDYRRVFTVDHTIDASGIRATIQDGVLRVDLPKSETLKPRRIEIA